MRALSRPVWRNYALDHAAAGRKPALSLLAMLAAAGLGGPGRAGTGSGTTWSRQSPAGPTGQRWVNTFTSRTGSPARTLPACQQNTGGPRPHAAWRG